MIWQMKIDKYRSLVDELKEKGYTVDLDAIVVDSLGSWDPADEKALRMLEIVYDWSLVGI